MEQSVAIEAARLSAQSRVTSNSFVGALVEATKPRITRLVTITSGVGFAMAGLGRSWRAEELIVTGTACVIGTALSAAGANALNQWMERDRDALMVRTCARPLPTRRVTPASVLGAGLLLSAAGVGLLLAACGPVPALLSLACILVYVLLYTPMKVMTPWATHVGTIPGALPPMIGWSAAWAGGGAASMQVAGGWSLFALMTVWQMPHFLAIAWMFKDDYRRGGYRVLPVLDNGENRTARSIAMWSLLLVPATMAPAWAMWGLIGAPYLVVSGVSAAAMVWLAARLIRERTRGAARKLFFASIIQLPVLLLAMVAEGLVRAAL
ncbi:MAG: protoheme IX farnesyltransferase [Phycisphaerae bacterium]